MGNKIKFIEGKKYIAEYGFTGNGEYTSIYMIKDNKKYFIGNIVKDLNNNDGYAKYNYKNRITEIENIKKILISNNGKYFKIYGKFDNPFEFIDWIKENNYKFQIFGELFEKHNNFVDFHGNLNEYSSAFHYRIYDLNMVNRLKEKIQEQKSLTKEVF